MKEKLKILLIKGKQKLGRTWLGTERREKSFLLQLRQLKNVQIRRKDWPKVK